VYGNTSVTFSFTAQASNGSWLNAMASALCDTGGLLEVQSQASHAYVPSLSFTDIPDGGTSFTMFTTGQLFPDSNYEFGGV
jgi:hypothetical protein